MKRNHVSLGKIRRVIVSLFALGILASAFFVTPLSAFADNPPADPCAVHAHKEYSLPPGPEKEKHQQMYMECVANLH